MLGEVGWHVSPQARGGVRMVSAEMGQRQNEESNQGRDGGKVGCSSGGRVGDGMCF